MCGHSAAGGSRGASRRLVKSILKTVLGECLPIAERPKGFVPIGIFFFFGSLMASYAAITLLFPGTFLDRAWKLNPHAHVQLLSKGLIMVLPFAALAIALLLAGVGWFKRRYWGWLIGVCLIAANLLGDLANLVLGNSLKGGAGVLIAGLLLLYMTRPGMRNYIRN